MNSTNAAVNGGIDVSAEDINAKGGIEISPGLLFPLVGQRLLGMMLAILGLLMVFNRDFSPSWQLVPQDAPGRQFIAILIGAMFCVGGIGLQFNKTARAAAWLLAGTLLLGLSTFSPRILERRLQYMPWLQIGEQSILVMAVSLIAANYSSRWQQIRARRLRLLCIGIGICELPLGLSHLVAIDGAASMVPAWLPPGQVEWVVLTAIFHFAAAIALISGERAVLAARGLVVMFAGFSILVWIPRTIASPENWQINAVHLLSWSLTAAVWILADALSAQRASQQSQSAPSSEPSRVGAAVAQNE
jgi:uncharacterized membrane protein